MMGSGQRLILSYRTNQSELLIGLFVFRIAGDLEDGIFDNLFDVLIDYFIVFKYQAAIFHVNRRDATQRQSINILDTRGAHVEIRILGNIALHQPDYNHLKPVSNSLQGNAINYVVLVVHRVSVVIG